MANEGYVDIKTVCVYPYSIYKHNSGVQLRVRLNECRDLPPSITEMTREHSIP